MADRFEIPRETAEAASTDLPAHPDRWKPSLWTFRLGDRRFAVKDVRRTTPLFRYTVGRLAIGHEARIYRRLDGLDFVPPYAGRLDRDALVLGWIEATDLRSHEPARVGDDFFDELQRCVGRLHQRGVAHMDLRHRTNILVGEDGKPRLIDFEIALHLGRLLVPLLGWVDRSAVTKFRIRYSPHQVSAAEVERYARFKRLRKLWRFGRIWPPRWLRRRSQQQRTTPP